MTGYLFAHRVSINEPAFNGDAESVIIYDVASSKVNCFCFISRFRGCNCFQWMVANAKSYAIGKSLFARPISSSTQPVLWLSIIFNKFVQFFCLTMCSNKWHRSSFIEGTSCEIPTRVSTEADFRMNRMENDEVYASQWKQLTSEVTTADLPAMH